MFDRISAVERHAGLEARGLVKGEPGARPGDIFSSAAVPNREAAIDVTVVSPEASAGGADCVATAHMKKSHGYRKAVDEWGPVRIILQLLVWSSEDRCHPDVDRVMDFVAALLARRTGVHKADGLGRWRTDVGVALAARRARMAQRCLPQQTARHQFVCHGALGSHEAEETAAAAGDVVGYGLAD